MNFRRLLSVSELTEHASYTVDRQKGRVQRLPGMNGIPAPPPALPWSGTDPFSGDSLWPEPLSVCQLMWVEAQLRRLQGVFLTQLKTLTGASLASLQTTSFGDGQEKPIPTLSTTQGSELIWFELYFSIRFCETLYQTLY